MRIKRILSAAALSLTIFLTPVSVYAQEPYEAYNYDRWDEAVPSQAGYVSDREVSGEDIGAGSFNDPRDIFRDENDIFYIADTGNNRIVAADKDLKKTVGVYDKFKMPDGSETALRSPTGVFVSGEKGLMYIADNENERILVCAMDGSVQLEITKPDSDIFDSKKTFLPQKTVVDKAGNIYAVLGNISTGAAMFSPTGDFLGFYGANKVEPTEEVVMDHFLDIFRSDEKKGRQARNIPTSITGFDIYGDFIFTCTSSSTQKTDTVKKMNPAGNNILYDTSIIFGDRTSMYDSKTNTSYETKIWDIDIGDEGNINVLDHTTGRVFQYDEDCNLLFITGTIARQLGGFQQPAALETMDGNLYVLDQQKNTVTIFKETSFGKLVHEAASLYNKGYYEEALQPWYEVLKRDGNYRRAAIGIASGLLNKGDYKGAMKYAELADSPKIYNKAFEGWRREFLDRNFGKIIAGAVVIISGAVMLRRRSRKKEGKKNA